MAKETMTIEEAFEKTHQRIDELIKSVAETGAANSIALSAVIAALAASSASAQSALIASMTSLSEKHELETVRLICSSLLQIARLELPPEEMPQSQNAHLRLVTDNPPE